MLIIWVKVFVCSLLANMGSDVCPVDCVFVKRKMYTLLEPESNSSSVGDGISAHTHTHTHTHTRTLQLTAKEMVTQLSPIPDW